MTECKVYKLGKDYFMDCGPKREAKEASGEEDKAGKAQKDSFSRQPKPEAPRLPWMGRPTFY